MIRSFEKTHAQQSRLWRVVIFDLSLKQQNGFHFIFTI